MSEFITNAELRIEAERLCDENDQLREENSKLRDVESENASLRGAVQGLGELCDKYKAENAKLRKLLEAILQCVGETKRDKGCDACPMYDWHDGCIQDHSWCKLRPNLREMGFEVPQCRR